MKQKYGHFEQLSLKLAQPCNHWSDFDDLCIKSIHCDLSYRVGLNEYILYLDFLSILGKEACTFFRKKHPFCSNFEPVVQSLIERYDIRPEQKMLVSSSTFRDHMSVLIR